MQSSRQFLRTYTCVKKKVICCMTYTDRLFSAPEPKLWSEVCRPSSVRRKLFTFSTSLKPLNGIQENFTGSKITSSTKFVFFGPIGKIKKPSWPLISWNILYFSCVNFDWDSTKLNRKQDLNVLYKIFVFSGRTQKHDGRPGLWLVETFSASPLLFTFSTSLKRLNGNQWNLTGSKTCVKEVHFVLSCTSVALLISFSWRMYGQTDMVIAIYPPPPIFSSPTSKAQVSNCHNASSVRPVSGVNFHMFDFSETDERNSTTIDKKQDPNVLY